ncbi:MAG: dihydrodipicolinate synthase family protein, partial [Paracoccaceae bacterium]
MTQPNPGIYAAVSTPLNENFAPDFGRLVTHCRWLLKNGCDGLAPLGTTGEANSLALSDRIAVIGHLAGAGLQMQKMIV